MRTRNEMMPPADAGPVERPVRPAAEARWYCIGRNGIATLCADQRDAKEVAFESDAQWPREAPHRAVQLVGASEIKALHDLLARQKASYEREIALEVASEREQCAKVCEEVATWAGTTWHKAGLDCAAWIRKRA